MRHAKGAKLFFLLMQNCFRDDKRTLLILILNGFLNVVFEVLSIYGLSLFFNADLRVDLIYKLDAAPIPFVSSGLIFIINNIQTVIIPFFMSSLFVRLYTSRQQFVLGAKLITKLSTKMLTSVITKPYDWHVQNDSSLVISTMTKDTDNVVETIKGFINLIANIPVILGLLFFVLLVNESSFGVLFFLVLSYCGLFLFSKEKLAKNGFRLSDSNHKVVALIQSTLFGIRTIKLDNMESEAIRSFSMETNLKNNASSEIMFVGTGTRLIAETLIIISILMWMMLQIFFNDQNLNILVLSTAPLAFALLRLVYPLQLTFNAISALKTTKQSAVNVLRILSLEPSTLPYRTASDLNLEFKPKFEPESGFVLPSIHFENLSFRYPSSSEDIFHNINAKFYPGTIYGLAGTSGEGKSTLMGVLTGLLKPTSGHVYLFDVDINNLTKEQKSIVNQNFSYIPQKVFFFNESILKNVTLKSQQNISEEDICKVWKILKIVEMFDFVRSLDSNLYTNVGENSTNLSGGQAQRLGIARALFKDPKILFMDEATSALDPRTQQIVCNNIKQMCHNKTVIMISHNPSSLEYCDEIFSLKALKTSTTKLI